MRKCVSIVSTFPVPTPTPTVLRDGSLSEILDTHTSLEDPSPKDELRTQKLHVYVRTSLERNTLGRWVTGLLKFNGQSRKNADWVLEL